MAAADALLMNSVATVLMTADVSLLMIPNRFASPARFAVDPLAALQPRLPIEFEAVLPPRNSSCKKIDERYGYSEDCCVRISEPNARNENGRPIKHAAMVKDTRQRTFLNRCE
jgi:hypothetical protein